VNSLCGLFLVTSTPDGVLEVGMHRRLATMGYPPAGLPEALNDTRPDYDRMLLIVSAPDFVADYSRQLQLRLEQPLQLLYAAKVCCYCCCCCVVCMCLRIYELHKVLNMCVDCACSCSGDRICLWVG